MNPYPIDYNIYNMFMYYTGGRHPSYNEYKYFEYTLNNPVQSLPPAFIPTMPNQIPMKISFCINGMSCKNIKCTDYHHPSKDLDIINSSRAIENS